MTYKQLKDFIETLTDDQLTQAVAVFSGDDETPIILDYGEISKEDMYWEHHGDCIGNKEDVRKAAAEQGISMEDYLEDLNEVPRGMVTLHSA